MSAALLLTTHGRTLTHAGTHYLSTRVPLLIRAPRHMSAGAAGAAAAAPFELIDLFPTLASLAGVPVRRARVGGVATLLNTQGASTVATVHTWRLPSGQATCFRETPASCHVCGYLAHWCPCCCHPDTFVGRWHRPERRLRRPLPHRPEGGGVRRGGRVQAQGQRHAPPPPLQVVMPLMYVLMPLLSPAGTLWGNDACPEGGWEGFMGCAPRRRLARTSRPHPAPTPRTPHRTPPPAAMLLSDVSSLCHRRRMPVPPPTLATPSSHPRRHAPNIPDTSAQTASPRSTSS